MTTALAPHAADEPDGFEAKLRDLFSDTYPVRIPTSAEVDAMLDHHDAARRVVEAARAWRLARGRTAPIGDYLSSIRTLIVAVDGLENAIAHEESVRNAAARPPVSPLTPAQPSAKGQGCPEVPGPPQGDDSTGTRGAR